MKIEQNILKQVYKSDIDKNGVVIIPKEVVEIGDNAFADCTAYVKKVVLPDGIEVFGEGAFRDCCNLIEFIIPKRTKVIKRCAFENCNQVYRFEIPETIKHIGYDAFSGTNLNGITRPRRISKRNLIDGYNAPDFIDKGYEDDIER